MVTLVKKWRSKYGYRLADLVRGVTSKNRHKAVETGEPRGEEAW